MTVTQLDYYFQTMALLSVWQFLNGGSRWKAYSRDREFREIREIREFSDSKSLDSLFFRGDRGYRGNRENKQRPPQ